MLGSTGCDQSNYSPNGVVVNNNPTSGNSLFNNSLENRIQTFVFPSNSGEVCLSSIQGVDICLNTDCFELNGDPVTNGDISLDYIEIFDNKKTVML